MSTIQDVIGDYTPLSNNVVKVLKLIKGSVACKIFFTSNLEDRICRMGLTRIADDLGIERSTASKAITSLVKDEYIERVKEATHTSPAHYRCTQKFYDLAGGVDVINRGVDVINRGIDVINQEEDSKEDTEEKSFTNVKDAPPNKTNDLNDLLNNRDSIITGLEQEIAELKALATPNGNAKPIKTESKNELYPPPIKPKTIIKDRFCELAGRKMPESKSGQKFWWGQFGIMLIEAGGDYERACWALGEVVPYMRANNLHIKDPHSVMGLFGEVLDGHKLNGKTNGSPKTDIAPGQAEKWSNLF